MRLRITRQRREFGLDGGPLIERESGETQPIDIKPGRQGADRSYKRKVLSIGL